MTLSLPNIKLLLWVFWALAFWATSNLLSGYEAIMNYAGKLTVTQLLISGAPPSAFTNTTNLFNEGVIGYVLMAFMFFCAFMFARELFSFQRLLRSLAHSDNLREGEVKDFV